MKKFVLASALVVSAFAAHAQAYGEIGYLATDVKAEFAGLGLKTSPEGIRAIFGYDVDPYMGIEAMAIFGTSDSSIKVDGLGTTDAKLDIRNSLGLYVKPKYKLSNKTEIFARIGFARVKAAESAPGFGTSTASETGLSYGLGVGFSVSKATSVNFDYMQYLNKDDIQANGFTVGLGFKF